MKFLLSIVAVAPLLIAADGVRQAKDGEEFELLAKHNLKSPILSLAIHPNERSILVAGGEFPFDPFATFDIFVMDLKTRNIVTRVKGHDSHVNALAFSKSGKFFCSADSGRAEIGRPRGVANIFLYSSKPKLQQSRKFEHPITQVQFTQSENIVALFMPKKGVVFWDHKKDRITSEIRSKNISAFKLHPDGKSLLSTTRDSRLVVWDIKKQVPVRRARLVDSSGRSLAVSTDGKTIAVGDWEHKITLLHGKTLKKIGKLDLSAGVVNNVEFSRDSALLFASTEMSGFGKNDGVTCWKLRAGGGRATRKKILAYNHATWVSALRVSSSARYVVSGDSDGDLYIYQKKTK